MKKNYLILGIIAFVVLIAVISNPNEDRHRSAVKTKILSYKIAESVKDIANSNNNEWEAAGKGIGTMLGGALVDQMVNSMVSSDNYLIFSTTKVTWEGKTKTIGFGTFGNVYLTDKIQEVLNSGYGNNNREDRVRSEKFREDSIAAVEAVKEAEMAVKWQTRQDSIAEYNKKHKN